MRGGLRARHPIRDPGSRRLRRTDQGVRGHAPQHAPPVRRGRVAHRRLHRVRGRALADATGARADRTDRARPRPRPRRRQGRSRRDRDAQLPGMDRRLRRDHLRRRGGGPDERVVADRRDGLRPRRLRVEDRHRRRRPARPAARRRSGVGHRDGGHRTRARRTPTGRPVPRGCAGGPADQRSDPARCRHRPRRRRHDPLHLGHHRASEGCGVLPPRGAQLADGVRGPRCRQCTAGERRRPIPTSPSPR